MSFKFSKIAIYFDTLRSGLRYRSWCVAQFANSRTKAQFLDIGCGAKPVIRDKRLRGVDKFVVAKGVIPASADDIPIGDNEVDVVFSAHCLEHCANPLAVLLEWTRILKADGKMVLVLPHADRTFDRIEELHHCRI